MFAVECWLFLISFEPFLAKLIRKTPGGVTDLI